MPMRRTLKNTTIQIDNNSGNSIVFVFKFIKKALNYPIIFTINKFNRIYTKKRTPFIKNLLVFLPLIWHLSSSKIIGMTLFDPIFILKMKQLFFWKKFKETCYNNEKKTKIHINNKRIGDCIHWKCVNIFGHHFVFFYSKRASPCPLNQKLRCNIMRTFGPNSP